MNRVEETWQNKWGELFKIVHNPCNCCPKSTMELRGKRFQKAVSYHLESRAALTKKLLKNGNLRLERKVIQLKGKKL